MPRKSVLRLTDRPDMTLDVYRGRKTTTLQQQLYGKYLHYSNRSNRGNKQRAKASCACSMCGKKVVFFIIFVEGVVLVSSIFDLSMPFLFFLFSLFLFLGDSLILDGNS